MKIGNTVVAVAMAMMVMGRSVLPGLEAQRDAFCDRVIRGDAPFSDAATAVQDLRLNPGQCCQTNNICSVVPSVGYAAISICNTVPGAKFCVSCADAGNYANQVLAECVEANLVQGSYDPDGSFSQLD